MPLPSRAAVPGDEEAVNRPGPGRFEMAAELLHGVSRDQFMGRHRANHLNVAYAPESATADEALLAKSAFFAELGVVVHLCGHVMPVESAAMGYR